MVRYVNLRRWVAMGLWIWGAGAWAATATDVDIDQIRLPSDMLEAPKSDDKPPAATAPVPPSKTVTPADIDIDKLTLPKDMVSPATANNQQAQTFGKRSLAMGGYIKNETAYRFDSPRAFSKIRDILYLNGQYTVGSWFKYNIAGWGYYDHAYDLYEYQTVTGRQRRDQNEPLVFHEGLPTEKDSPVAALRESYVDLYMKNLDIRLGKQYIIWGLLEGVRVVDEINPMDFRELILPDLLDYRVSQWSAKLNYYTNFADFELVWIPDLQFHKAAPAGSEWELFQVLPQTTFPKSCDFNLSWERGRKQPGVSFPNGCDLRFSEIGGRVSKKLFDIDFTLSYWYGWDLYPVVFRLISREDILRAPAGSNIPIYPTYTRISMYGITFSRELEGNILKGEFAYVKNKYFAIVDIDANGDSFLDQDGEIKRDHVRWGVGYDFNLWGADVSTALTQWIIINYDRAILQDEVDTSFNVFIRKPLQKRSAVLTLLVIKLINFDETLIKPKITFELSDHFQLAAGVDWFVGEPTQFGRQFDVTAPGNLVDVAQQAQFLGNFRDNRRLFVDFKYSF
ncbi:MAG: hypothetical protein OEW08_06220 [Gammaproteobacteria bacterium]|nr:hypothetical protein [Gammaproteobacteria bacterium]